MTKPKFVKYTCEECYTPCNYFFEPKKYINQDLYCPPTKCICDDHLVAKWKRVDRFTKNGI